MAIIDDKNGYGGVTTHLLHMCEALNGYPIDLTLFVANKNIYKKAQNYAEVVEITFDESGVEELTKCVEKEKFHIVNLHASSHIQEEFFKNKGNYKILVTGHGIYDDDEVDMMREYFQLLIDRTDLLVNVSLAARLPYLNFGINPQKSYLIYNAVRLNSFNYENEKNNKIKKLIYVGRLSYEKGVMKLLELARYFSKSLNNQICIEIWGDGPAKEKMQEMILEYGIEEYCILKGFSDNIEQKYSEYDALILPSETESCSYTILEAMAQKLLVIASKIEGNKELVINETTGYLLDFECIDKAAEKVYEILLKNNHSLVENAYLRLEKNFSITRFGEEYFCAISSLIETK